METNHTIPLTTQSENLSYLNYLRFGSILMVILLHCLSGFIVNPHFFPLPSYKLILAFNEIGRAGVPLFFMMSGYLLLRNPRTADCIPFYKKRLSRILIPLVIWNAVYCVHYHKDVGTYFAESINQGCPYHLWFLYMILGIYLLTPFLKQIVDHCTRKQLWWLLALICFAGTLRPLFNLTTPFYLYLFPSMMEGYIGYFLFGYLLGTAPSGKKNEPLLALLLLLSGFALGVFGNFLLSSQEQLTLPFNSGYSINHYLLAGGIFLLARSCRWMERPRAGSIGRLLSTLTFQIYFVHVLILERSASLLPDTGPIFIILLSFLITAMGSILFSLALHGISKLLRTKKSSPV